MKTHSLTWCKKHEKLANYGGFYISDNRNFIDKWMYKHRIRECGAVNPAPLAKPANSTNNGAGCN